MAGSLMEQHPEKRGTENGEKRQERFSNGSDHRRDDDGPHLCAHIVRWRWRREDRRQHKPTKTGKQ